MLEKNYIPKLPFPDFKWKWASLQCTESLNDPVILLGVLFRMRKLETNGLKYSSPEFAHELEELSNDVKDSIGINLAGRTGERNLIRNSGQYWRAVGLLEDGDRTGLIHLTEFGRRVADRDVTQTEFAAITIQTFKLPNIKIQNTDECQMWLDNGLVLYPLRLLLSIAKELNAQGEYFITTEELIKIVIPLSSNPNTTVDDYIHFILWYRAKEITLIGWPDCCPRDNDTRIAREYLLFLSNYGYLVKTQGKTRMAEQYAYNSLLDNEITSILAEKTSDQSLIQAVTQIRTKEIAAEIEKKRVDENTRTRPNQAKFRKEILQACERCIITNVTMPEVLEAAHIKPFKYHGEDTVANGFAMRMDIHLLFDSGHLRISEKGDIQLSTRARMDYGATIPPRIVLPNFTNTEFLKWRWENYNGL
ncbi:HNH endonuclease [Spirochaetia bacterium]|nr:HNH endonuclease [Spirochaetia bacterium]